MASHSESLPYNGQLFKAKNKKFEETVLLVPFFNAEQKSLIRHVRFVNQLGFDAVTFELHKTPAMLDFSKGILTPLKQWQQLGETWKPPINAKLKFGLKHVYADQIENLLNLIPGNKIVYSFSNPSAAAIEALARRYAADVTGLICDSGPSGKFVESFVNLAKHEWKIDSALLRFSMAPILSFTWSPQLHKDVEADLNALPKGFKLLSIRGWKDVLVPPYHIDAIFDRQENVAWQRLSLPAAGHLNGLRDFADEYKPVVSKFLEEVATSLQKEAKPTKAAGSAKTAETSKPSRSAKAPARSTAAKAKTKTRQQRIH